MSRQSSEIDKYKTTLNFDEISGDSLGILSSEPGSCRKLQHEMFFENHNAAIKNLMHSLLTPNKEQNLKIEELAGHKKPAPRASRWNETVSSRSSVLDKMQDLMTEKERVRVEIEKIELNKSLTRQDR